MLAGLPLYLFLFLVTQVFRSSTYNSLQSGFHLILVWQKCGMSSWECPSMNPWKVCCVLNMLSLIIKLPKMRTVLLWNLLFIRSSSSCLEITCSGGQSAALANNRVWPQPLVSFCSVMDPVESRQDVINMCMWWMNTHNKLCFQQTEVILLWKFYTTHWKAVVPEHYCSKRHINSFG